MPRIFLITQMITSLQQFLFFEHDSYNVRRILFALCVLEFFSNLSSAQVHIGGHRRLKGGVFFCNARLLMHRILEKIALHPGGSFLRFQNLAFSPLVRKLSQLSSRLMKKAWYPLSACYFSQRVPVLHTT